MVVVSSPIGGFANHTTWLLWIHPEFKSFIQRYSFTDEEFEAVRGSDWPTIYNIDTVTNPSIIQNLEKYEFIDVYPEDPVQFILDKVYTEDRSWHNWLLREWYYRNRIYNFEVAHTPEMHYTVLCTIDPKVAYKNYLKINSNLNSCSLDDFLQEIKDFNNKTINSNNLVVDNTVLFNPKLNVDYYKQLTEYFKLEDRYEQAQIVHDAWYRAQIRSETEFKAEVNRVYGS